MPPSSHRAPKLRSQPTTRGLCRRLRLSARNSSPPAPAVSAACAQRAFGKRTASTHMRRSHNCVCRRCRLHTRIHAPSTAGHHEHDRRSRRTRASIHRSQPRQSRAMPERAPSAVPPQAALERDLPIPPAPEPAQAGAESLQPLRPSSPLHFVPDHSYLFLPSHGWLSSHPSLSLMIEQTRHQIARTKKP